MRDKSKILMFQCDGDGQMVYLTSWDAPRLDEKYAAAYPMPFPCSDGSGCWCVYIWGNEYKIWCPPPNLEQAD